VSEDVHEKPGVASVRVEVGAAQLTELLAGVAPRAIGAQVTVFDPDLDPDGRHARLLVDILAHGLSGLGQWR
jgi:arginase